jgi:hypothetical protein
MIDLTRIHSEAHRLPGEEPARDPYPPGLLVSADAARAKIQKLLVTGDNRLKQGVDPAKARQSYEQALEAAREAGLEDAILPLVEIRLADLERLARESPPPSPPDA